MGLPRPPGSPIALPAASCGHPCQWSSHSVRALVRAERTTHYSRDLLPDTASCPTDTGTVRRAVRKRWNAVIIALALPQSSTCYQDLDHQVPNLVVSVNEAVNVFALLYLRLP